MRSGKLAIRQERNTKMIRNKRWQENKRPDNVIEGTKNIKLNTLKASMFEFDENWAIEIFVFLSQKNQYFFIVTTTIKHCFLFNKFQFIIFLTTFGIAYNILIYQLKCPRIGSSFRQMNISKNVTCENDNTSSPTCMHVYNTHLPAHMHTCRLTNN